MQAAALISLMAALSPAPVVRVATTAAATRVTADFIVRDGPTQVDLLGGSVDLTTGVALGDVTLTVRESLGAAPPVFEPLGADVKPYVSDALLAAGWTTELIETLRVTLEGGALLPISTVSREVGSFGGVAAQARIDWTPGPVDVWVAIDGADHPLGSDGEINPLSDGPRVPNPPRSPGAARMGLACDPLSSDALFRYACMPDPRASTGAVVGGALNVLDDHLRVEAAATLTTNVAVPLALLVGAPYWDQHGDTRLQARAAVRVRPVDDRLIEVNGGALASGAYNPVVVGFASLVVGL